MTGEVPGVAGGECHGRVVSHEGSVILMCYPHVLYSCVIHMCYAHVLYS